MKSPLRYPGGKAKLANFFQKLIEDNDLSDVTYLEPYAGGCGLALELLERNLVKRITLNDADPAIYKFWCSVLNEPESLCSLITNTPVTLEEWRNQKKILGDQDGFSDLEVGFSVFFLNRTNRSGIIKGAGVIGGYEQKGNWKIDARYYPETMVKRIRAIAKKKQRIRFFNKDALDFCKNHVRKTNLVYLDPPYFEKGHRLYRNFYNPEDHLEISTYVQNDLKSNWVVSYDNAPEIMEYYKASNSFVYGLPYTATKRREGTEVIFFSNNLKIPNLCAPMIEINQAA